MSKFIPNSFQVPNAVIDELMAELTGAELKCYLYVLRKTKGWNKEFDAISVTQFMESCNLSNRTVIDACDRLVELGLLEQKTGSNRIKIFSVKSYEIDLSGSEESSQREKSSVVKKVHSGSEKSSLSVVKKVHIQNNNTKNNIQNTNNLSLQTKTSATSPTKKFSFSDMDLAMAKEMFARIQKLNPNHKQPNFEAWANDIRLLGERDGKSHSEIIELFEWANQDRFWQANILSPRKLREKWDVLVLQRNRQAKPRGDNLSMEWNTAEAWENVL